MNLKLFNDCSLMAGAKYTWFSGHKLFVSFSIFNEHLQRGFLSVIQFNDLFLSTEVYLKRITGKLYQNSKLNLSSSSSVGMAN